MGLGWLPLKAVGRRGGYEVWSAAAVTVDMVRGVIVYRAVRK